jgi:hypothetical protein
MDQNLRDGTVDRHEYLIEDTRCPGWKSGGEYPKPPEKQSIDW